MNIKSYWEQGLIKYTTAKQLTMKYACRTLCIRGNCVKGFANTHAKSSHSMDTVTLKQTSTKIPTSISSQNLLNHTPFHFMFF